MIYSQNVNYKRWYFAPSYRHASHKGGETTNVCDCQVKQAGSLIDVAKMGQEKDCRHYEPLKLVDKWDLPTKLFYKWGLPNIHAVINISNHWGKVI